MTPQQHQEWTDVPALQRMRDELAEVAAREAPAPAPRRRAPRRRIGLALAGVLAAAVVGIVLVAGSDEEAVADLRDAPQALLEAGRYAYSTTTTLEVPGRNTGNPVTIDGEVDQKANAFRFTNPGRAGRDLDVVVIGDDYYAHLPSRTDPDPDWQRDKLPGGATALSGDSVPLSLASVRALRDATREKVVSTNEQVDGIATTHYRLKMNAADYAGLRGQDAADLRDVPGTLDVWLDGDDLPRRLRARFGAAGGPRYTIDTRYERFGRTEPVRAPAASVPGAVAPLLGDPIVGSLQVTFGSR